MMGHRRPECNVALKIPPAEGNFRARINSIMRGRSFTNTDSPVHILHVVDGSSVNPEYYNTEDLVWEDFEEQGNE